MLTFENSLAKDVSNYNYNDIEKFATAEKKKRTKFIKKKYTLNENKDCLLTQILTGIMYHIWQIYATICYVRM